VRSTTRQVGREVGRKVGRKVGREVGREVRYAPLSGRQATLLHRWWLPQRPVSTARSLTRREWWVWAW